MEVSQTLDCLAISWAGALYIHLWGLLPHNGILPGAKFTWRLSLAFSYIGIVTAQHSSTGRQANMRQAYIWHEGHHVGHRPTF